MKRTTVREMIKSGKRIHDRGEAFKIPWGAACESASQRGIRGPEVRRKPLFLSRYWHYRHCYGIRSP